MRIVVSGMVAAVPDQGGAAWAVLQYVLGFAALGHDVFLVEPLAPPSIRPAGATLDSSRNAEYFAAICRRFGLEGRAALVDAQTGASVGMTPAQLQALVERTDVLFNVSGMLAAPQLLEPVPTRVYLDLDPVFNQLWHAVENIDMRFDGHTHFVTVGQRIGSDGCRVPDCGRRWIRTWQPVVLEHWPVATELTYDAMTTVANWRGYGSIQHDGVLFGQKAHSLRRFLDLPRATGERFALALAIDPGEARDLEALHANGWQLLEPAAVASTPDAYRAFVQGSRAEFGVAKSGYVEGNCGWFSDRSVCYLASGRPVLAQDTGISDLLPTGAGLLTFRDGAEAAAGVAALQQDYPRHRRAARELAEAYFDARLVLPRLLDAVGGSA